MKRKKIFFKLLFIAIFTIVISSAFYNSYGYQIHHIIETKEELGKKNDSSFPEMVYRKQVSAYSKTIEKYDNEIFPVKKDGWVYASDMNSADYPKDFSFTKEKNDMLHTDKLSFIRVYEYFHKYQNSGYDTDKSTSDAAKHGAKERYYATGTLKIGNSIDESPKEKKMSAASVWNVWGEKDEYTGLYWKVASRGDPSGFNTNFMDKNDIVILNSNLYRFAVKNSVFISDNIMNSELVANLLKTFGNGNNSKTLTVYGSSVLRTSSENAKNGEVYYQNMDTAFKFWETTVRGNSTASDNWFESPSTTGKDWGGNIQSTRSVINYYDNTYEIPITVVPKQIYIRHIDVTNTEEIKSQNINNSMVIEVVNGQVIIQKPNYNSPFTGTYKSPSKRNPYDEDGHKYTELYQKSSSGEDWRFGNIKYNNSTLGNMSYLNPKALAGETGYALSSKESDIYNNYTCIGAVVGKGNSLNDAISKRNNTLNSTTNFRTASATSSSTGAIIKGGKDTNVIVQDSDTNEYIVIDFYYEKQPVSEKYVYVRHIDVTDFKNSITAAKVDQAIDEGKVLDGQGWASKLTTPTTTIYKQSIYISGYQELYKADSSYDLKVFRDPETDDYNCIGSNVTSSNTGSISAAKRSMDSKLNSSSKYDSSKKESRTVKPNSNSDVILIDFYYTSKHTGKLLDRTKKGRLAFYTTTASSGFTNAVDNHTDSDTAIVYDVIPSNESLRPSIDNAYMYMLGAINIKDQTKEGTYTFSYTITQNYEVKYYDYYAQCPSHGYNTTVKNIYDQDEYLKDPDTCSVCMKEKEGECVRECGKKFKVYKSEESITGSVSKTYTYTIPYNYTYYKIKNMRLYTISKMELFDGYNNNGLPLFDGKTHTILPSTNYKSSFSDNSTFSTSSDNGSLNRNSKELGTTLIYNCKNKELDECEDNGKGDIDTNTLKSQVEAKINEFLDKFNHSDAAKINSINKEGKKTDTTDHLKATLNIKNDQVYFTDKVANRTIYIVGDPNKNNSTTTGNPSYVKSSSRSEQSATKVIDLYEYTKGKTRSGSGTSWSKYTYTTTEADKISLSTVYPKSVKGKYMPDDLTNNETHSYFETLNLNIPESRLNGKHYSYGKIQYTLLSGNKNLNFDVDDSRVTNGDHNWNNDSNRKVVNGKKGNKFIDTEMYNDSGVANPSTTTMITPSALSSNIQFEYGKDNTSDADIVDIFTPISFSTQIISNISSGSETIVDHTTTPTTSGYTKPIQKNSKFTIEMTATKRTSTYINLPTAKYLGQYYIKFNFDVQDIKIYDAKNSGGRSYIAGSVPAETWIGPIYNKYGTTYADNGKVQISAFALADPYEASSVVNQETNEYVVRAVANNAPESLIYDVARGRISDAWEFITDIHNTFRGTDGTGGINRDHNSYYDQKNIYGQSNYVAEINVETENISRVYDFKVTDLKDVDWKNIFRKSSATTTNVHSGKAYYSGVKKWNIYTTKYNEMLERTVSEIGATKQQILPLGPYKNTNTTYIKAPKLGYKFSFDLKTTGANSNKRVVITPSFYYIKKDGSGYTTDIKLYYKNSNNKYVTIDNYNLYFVPNDGYRLTFEGTDASYRFTNSSMSKSSIYLGKADINEKGEGAITLDKNMMQQADNMFVQIWYGEYKLPNSTIVVGKDASGKYNINSSRLTNGYIGVKFNIEVYEYTTSSLATVSKIVNYAQDNKNATSTTNTSQWDYEGYLGFSDPGKPANNIRIALEKGTWKLDNDMYNKIKGTVILYDTDAKASSDYD